MDKIQALVIEDEKPSARKLVRMLGSYPIDILGVLHSVKSARAWLQQNDAPELIFLDIQLSDGLSFEIFEENQPDSFIIFTTAFDEYAVQAFKLNSIDYLLKPIDEDELQVAIEKYRSFHNKSTSNFDFAQLKQIISGSTQKAMGIKNRFSIKIGSKIKSISTSEIVCFYSENKGTYIRTSEDRSYLIDTTIDILEGKLDKSNFHRVSRKFILNIHYIKESHQFSNSRLKVVLHHFLDGDIIVSRERVKEFKQWLG